MTRKKVFRRGGCPIRQERAIIRKIEAKLNKLPDHEWTAYLKRQEELFRKRDERRRLKV